MSTQGSESPVSKKNWFVRHKIITGCLALFIFFIIIGLVSGDSNNNPSSQSSAPKSSTSAKNNEEASQKEVVAAKIGDTVVDSDLAFTVTNVSTAKALGNQFTRKESQGTFYVVTVKIANQSKDTKTIDSSMFQITDSQGRNFDRSIDGQTAVGMSKGKIDIFLQQVQPSLSVTGDLVFDLPADVTGLKLIVKGGIFSSGKEIQLQK